MQNHSTDAHASGQTGVGRRALVRTGVWAVPVVTLAVAAPAMAAHSGGAATLSFDTLNVFGADYTDSGDATTLESQIQVQNRFVTGGPTLPSLSVTVTYPAGRVTGAAPTHLTGSGWGFASALQSSGAWRYTFTWVGTLVTSKSTSTLDYRVARTDTTSETLTITGIAIASGVASATGSASAKLR